MENISESIFDPQQQKDRTLSDASLLSEGAEYDEKGNLIITEKQEENTREMMDQEIMAKNLLKLFKLKDFWTIVIALNNESARLYNDPKSNAEEKQRAFDLSHKLSKIYNVANKIDQKTDSDKNELPK